MRPYKWVETDEQYLAVVQPEELFIEGSLFEKGRYKYWTKWSGNLKDTGESDLYAFGWLKNYCTREQAEREASNMPDELSWKPEQDAKGRVA